jgi:hypothetical protein
MCSSITTNEGWAKMTDDEFRQRVLGPVLTEAKRRLFTVKLDPFCLLGRNMGRGGMASKRDYARRITHRIKAGTG